MRCLAKAPERRFQTALDVRNEIEELKREIDSGELARDEQPGPARSSRRRWLGLLAGAAVGAAAVAAILLFRQDRGGEGAQSPQVSLTRFTDLPGYQGEPSLSSDGKMVAYVNLGGHRARIDQADIYLRRVGGGNAINLTADSPVDDSEPAFSPDGNFIAFRSERDGGGLYVMGATGESPRRITDFGHYPSWSPDGAGLLFSTEPVKTPTLGPNKSQIWTVDLESGATRLVLEEPAAHPVWSPRGLRIAYWAVRGGRRDLWTILPDGSDPQAVTDDDATDWRPLWTADGAYLYFVSDRGGVDNIWRIPIDEPSGRPRGAPEPITAGTSTIGSYSLSQDGRLIACEVTAMEARLLKVGFDPRTVTLQGDPVPVMSSLAAAPELSPDGEWITYMTMFAQEDIFVVRSDGTGVRRLTDDPFRDRAPTWSPAGDRIAFFSNRSGKYEVWTIRPDGSGLRQETDRPDHDLLAPIWSPDGSKIACGDRAGAAFIVDLAGDPQRPKGVESMTALPPFGNEGERFLPSAWSPDGRRIAGMVRDGRGNDIGISTFFLESRRHTPLIRIPGNVDMNSIARWLPDNRRLLYNRDGRLFALDIDKGNEREVPTPPIPEAGFRAYFLSRDGRTLLEVNATSNWDIWLIELQAAGR